MQKPIPADEVFQDMVFPMHGLDLSCEYDQQPPGTTPVGINVRANEPGELRQRGGQRPGLSKYITDQIPEGAVVIQHLNVIVDPTTLAMSDNVDSDDDDAVSDPSDGARNPGRIIRNGGWGRQPNRNRVATIYGLGLYIFVGDQTLSSSSEVFTVKINGTQVWTGSPKAIEYAVSRTTSAAFSAAISGDTTLPSSFGTFSSGLLVRPGANTLKVTCAGGALGGLGSVAVRVKARPPANWSSGANSLGVLAFGLTGDGDYTLVFDTTGFTPMP